MTDWKCVDSHSFTEKVSRGMEAPRCHPELVSGVLAGVSQEVMMASVLPSCPDGVSCGQGCKVNGAR